MNDVMLGKPKAREMFLKYYDKFAPKEHKKKEEGPRTVVILPAKNPRPK